MNIRECITQSIRKLHFTINSMLLRNGSANPRRQIPFSPNYAYDQVLLVTSQEADD